MHKQRYTIRYGKTVVHFGLGVVENLANAVHGYRRVHIVTSRRAARLSGALNDVEEVLNKCGVSYEIFDQVRPNPTYDIIEQLADDIRRLSSEAVIAVGGGSVIDSAKLGSMLALCGGRLRDYAFLGKPVCGSKPVIAVNLTHGTGSEVDRYAVVTFDNPKTKYGIASEHLYPVVSLDDPRYTLTLPRNQVIYVTIDALYHAYEAATGVDSSPYVLMLAEEVVKNIVKWLPVAVRDPDNLEARYWLLYASMLAGMAIDNSRAHLVHAIENVLSGLNPELPHGAGLGMLGPFAAVYIHRAAPAESHLLLRHIDPSIRPTESDAERACRTLLKFQESVGFDEELSNYGFKEDDVNTVVETAFGVLSYGLRLAPFNVGAEVIRSIYLSALSPSSRLCT